MPRNGNDDAFTMPPWVWFLTILLGIFVLILFFAVIVLFHQIGERDAQMQVTPAEALALHLQIFEAFLAALSISLAVFGIVGYAAIRNAAMRRAEEVSRETTLAYMRLTAGNQGTQQPELAGFSPEEGGPPVPEQEL